VAVIGGGFAGLVCAGLLKEEHDVVVFDMGRGPGGRACVRMQDVHGSQVTFDHGAQHIREGKDEGFIRLFRQWEEAGFVSRWNCRLSRVALDPSSDSQSLESLDWPLYVSIPGMNAVCVHLAKQVSTRSGVAVSRAERRGNLWALTSKTGDDLGEFDSIVCADKMIFKKGSPGYIDMVGEVPDAIRDIASRVGSISSRGRFMAMLTFTGESLDGLLPFDAAYIEGSETVEWVARNSSKPCRDSTGGTIDCWVIESTEAYAESILAGAPLQTNGVFNPAGHDLLDAVGSILSQEFARIVKLVSGVSPSEPLTVRAQRWGSAFPSCPNDIEGGCLADSESGLVACGDWAVSPDIEGAVVSGLAAAEFVQGYLLT